MKVTLTSLELKGPMKFFALSAAAFKIMKQMKTTGHLAFKKRGIWTTHYTMSLWPNEESLKAFARSGAHLEAMKRSKDIAKEIRTFTYDADELPNWKKAKELLKQAKVLRY
ncbi:MAG: DUF3291 domain-containing protein [Bacteroidia bacterium]|jgi:hypothetical protein|nr:DUF3291 domain-containing protein [Bacteroidia bacterium]